MISDSAFSLTILIYVSVAFLLVFFLFCWKTNGNGNGSEGLVKECPLLTNDQIISPPKIIPPTPSCDGQFVDIEMSKIDNEYWCYWKMENIHDEMIINKNKDSFWIHICLAFKKIPYFIGNFTSYIYNIRFFSVLKSWNHT